MATLFVDKLDPQSGTTLEIGTSGDTVTVPTGVTVAGGLANIPAFSVKLNSAMAISNNTNTKVTYDVEQVDTDSAFASNKFTVPAGGAGTYYFIHAPTIQSTGAGATLCRSLVYVNGVAVARSDSRIVTGTGHYENTPIAIYMATLSVSDYVEGYARIEGGTSTITVESGARSWFIGYKIIGA